MEEEDPEEEPDEEDSREDRRESDPVEESREALEGEPVEMPIEEPVVAPVEAEGIPGGQVPILPIEDEPGHEEEGDLQSRDIHMIIPPIFEPLSPFFSPLHTESLEPMSPFSGSVFAAPG